MPDRRTVLRSTASGVIVAVAGCVDGAERTIDRTGETETEAGSAGQSAGESDDGVGGRVDEEAVERAAELGRRVRESVVYLESSVGPRGSKDAPAFCFEGGDYLVTNAHNVRDADAFTAWTFEGERHDAELLGHVDSMQPDLALLRADGLGLEPLSAGSTDSLERGQPLFQVGHPSIMGNWIITVGPYLEQMGRGTGSLQSRVPGMQGNSGSPLLTLDGDLVGVTSGATSPERRGPDDPPARPESDDAHTELIGRMISIHVPVEAVTEKVAEWR